MESVNSLIRSGSRNKSVIVEVFIQHPGNYIELTDAAYRKLPCNYLKSHLMEKLTVKIDFNIGNPELTMETIVEEHMKQLGKKYQIIHFQVIQQIDLWTKG